MNAVSVYLRQKKYLICTMQGAGGLPCIEAGPVTILEESVTHEKFGAEIRNGLELTRNNYPVPGSKADWDRVSEAIFKAAGVKSWASLVKRASNLSIDQVGDSFTVKPGKRDRQGYIPLSDRESVIVHPSNSELGQLIAYELNRSFVEESQV